MLFASSDQAYDANSRASPEDFTAIITSSSEATGVLTTGLADHGTLSTGDSSSALSPDDPVIISAYVNADGSLVALDLAATMELLHDPQTTTADVEPASSTTIIGSSRDSPVPASNSVLSRDTLIVSAFGDIVDLTGVHTWALLQLVSLAVILGVTLIYGMRHRHKTGGGMFFSNGLAGGADSGFSLI